MDYVIKINKFYPILIPIPDNAKNGENVKPIESKMRER